MAPDRRCAALFRAGMLGVTLCLAPGCTLLDDVLPGTPFTPDQPEARITLIGEMHIDPTSGTEENCPPGGTLLWGQVQNSGDIDLVDVGMKIDAFDAADRLLGTYSVSVYSGAVVDVDTPDEETVSAASSSLIVDQSGTFSVCTSLRFGSVARTDYRPSYCYLLKDEIVCEAL